MAYAMSEDMGVDSDGRAYSSRREMWVEEAGEDLASGCQVNAEKKMQWYSKGVSYWEVRPFQPQSSSGPLVLQIIQRG